MRVVIVSVLEGVTGVDDYRLVLWANTGRYRQACVHLTEGINALRLPCSAWWGMKKAN